MSSADARRQRIYHWIGLFYSRVPDLARCWGRGYEALTFDTVPFARMPKPLRACRLQSGVPRG
jgi:hypothetical protein